MRFNLVRTLVSRTVHHTGTVQAVELIRTDAGPWIPRESPPLRPHVTTLDFSLLGEEEYFEGKNPIKSDILPFLHSMSADIC
jgi:hypothetical protein